MLDPQNKMAAYDFHGTVARWRTTPEKFEELWNAPQTEVPNSHGRVRLGKMESLSNVAALCLWTNFREFL